MTKSALPITCSCLFYTNAHISIIYMYIHVYTPTHVAAYCRVLHYIYSRDYFIITAVVIMTLTITIPIPCLHHVHTHTHTHTHTALNYICTGIRLYMYRHQTIYVQASGCVYLCTNIMQLQQHITCAYGTIIVTLLNELLIAPRDRHNTTRLSFIKGIGNKHNSFHHLRTMYCL